MGAGGCNVRGAKTKREGRVPAASVLEWRDSLSARKESSAGSSPVVDRESHPQRLWRGSTEDETARDLLVGGNNLTIKKKKWTGCRRSKLL
jgi:hypothetical protein